MKNESNSEPSGPAKPVFLGTAGFHYQDWVGPFYPPNLSPSAWFEFYSKEFPCVELNASFYSWISAKTTQRFAERAPDGFRFNMKVHRSLTHEIQSVPNGIRAMLESARPLRETDHFGVFLAQFPVSFRPTAEAKRHIIALAERLSPLCVEFRSSDWQEGPAEVLAKQAGISVVSVDGPQISGLPEPRLEPGTIGYLRLHGRNRKKWYDHEEAWERYDYLYSENELRELMPLANALIEEKRETYIIFNNHYGAQAVTNARQLASLLGLPLQPAQRELF
ncbi:MAG: hypothetical protein KatS3mg015_1420 [Fimbriimonadales bacterium]|nr:MAG: hypothetical protein KatS3mg015_1420 [Fimbriimonadales bacterium]